MRIIKKNCKLDYSKSTKQKIYSRIAIISIYKLDKLKATLNTIIIHPI